VISGPANSVRALADRGETATVTADYSNYTAPATVNDDFAAGGGSGFASLTETNITAHAVPGFADGPGGDYHLLASSPLIDIGDPAAPAPGSTDLDGDPRAILGKPACAVRRDIGADEFSPAAPLALSDCVAPDTGVSGKSKVMTKKKKARVSFTLTSTDAGSSFQCSLDGAAFAPCSSPFSTKVRVGSHVLTVRATDAGGNQDATPAKFDFKVKKKKLPKK
jgi:hypothetical protein